MGDILTGDSNGNVLAWPRGTNRVGKTIANAHEGGVFTICVMKDGNVITGGGKDRRITEWDHRLSRTGRQAEVCNLVFLLDGLHFCDLYACAKSWQLAQK